MTTCTPEYVAGDRALAEQLARAARYGAWEPAVEQINALICWLQATTRERDVYLGLLDLKMAEASLGGSDGKS